MGCSMLKLEDTVGIWAVVGFKRKLGMCENISELDKAGYISQDVFCCLIVKVKT